jgi:glycolate oxidase subunit GlcD
MISADFLRELKKIVGVEHVAACRCDTEVYSYDASQAVGAPDAVVFPGDTLQTRAVVRLAAESRVPCIPRGFGTNLSGGSIAPRGGLILVFSRMNRILTLRPEGRYAVVQPGVTNLELQTALAPLGFHFAPDPASQKASTLGGNAGENAGGPHCLKYGVTTNHILGMTVVLSSGEVVCVGGAALDPPGYDLRGILVGSEGTLGIITELVVRILPVPESVVTLLVAYDNVADAAHSVSAIIAAGIVPATLEMLDAPVIRAIEESKPCGYPHDAAAVLIAEVDGPAAGLPRQAEAIAELCRQNRCRDVRRARDTAERDLLWAGRRGAFGALARLAPNFLVSDCTVPRTRLPDALARVTEVAAKHALSYGNVFHAGDGNLHPVLLFDSRDPEQMERVHRAGREIMEACVALGGTITGEHGVGVEKADAMRLLFSEDDLEFQRRLRTAFDPSDLINPGKIFPQKLQIADCRLQNSAFNLQSAICNLHFPELVPADVAEAREMVRCACRDGVALIPRGNNTLPDFGNHSERTALPLCSTRLTAVKEYDPANQVVAIEAGMSLTALQDLLGQHGQWLPLRPPRASRHTVGGMVALGACGPERLRYGAPRDLLLGLKFIGGAGQAIVAGGRVVKNVAGFDLTRLLAGSAGTLGFITEATFRVLALPSCCLTLVGSGSLISCGAAANDLLRSKIDPSFLVAVPEDPALRMESGTGWQLLAGFEGFQETVDFQVETGRALLQKHGLTCPSPRPFSAREGVCQTFFDVLDRAPFLLRFDLPPDQVVPFLSAHPGRWQGAAVLADGGCGRLTVSLPDLEDQAWTHWCTAAREAQGHVLLERAPQEFRRRHDLFGLPRPEWTLVHNLKSILDPGNIFSPGCLPGRK